MRWVSTLSYRGQRSGAGVSILYAAAICTTSSASTAAQLRTAARHPVGRTGDRLCRPTPSPQLYPVGTVGRGLRRSLVAAERSGSRRGRCLLVWVACLDRARVQSHQTRGLAVAAHTHDRSQRAARLWLAVAVATLWLLSVGGEAEDTIPVGTLPALPANLLLP